MTGAGRFGGLVTAMVTPFDDRGGLDVPGAATLARWLVEHGSDALVLSGSTGEATALSDAERLELWRAVRQEVTVPLIAGTGTADTAHTIELTRSAQEAGADAVLVVTPYYNRPSQAGLYAHFDAVAQATSLPVVVYDIPSRTGRKLEPCTTLELARGVANIVGIKDSGGDVAATGKLVAESPAGFEVYCGDDNLVLPMLSVGASGLVSVASHWAGEELAAAISSFLEGDIARARLLNAGLIPSFEFESSADAPNPLPAKAMMRIMGLPSGQCRMPLGPAPPELEHRARNCLAQLRRAMREAKRTHGGGDAAGRRRGEDVEPGQHVAADPVAVSPHAGAEPGRSGA